MAKRIENLDYNPAHALWYTLTHHIGIPESYLHSASFLAAANTLSTEERGISVLFGSQARATSAIAYVKSILAHIDGVLLFDTDGKFHLKLIRDDYDVEQLLEVDEDMFLGEPKVEASLNRKGWGGTVGEVKVQYSHRTEVINVRVTQAAIEVLRIGKPYVRFTQAAVEVLRDGAPTVRSTQHATEVLREMWKPPHGNCTRNHQITNASFETGDVTGWTTEEGSPGVGTVDYYGTGAKEGTYFFRGGITNEDCQISQEIDLLADGVPAEALDSGTCWFTLSYYQGRYSSGNDAGKGGLRFKDASKTEITTEWNSLTNYACWTARSVTTQAPPGTRYVDVLLFANYGGTNADGYFDVIQLESDWCGNYAPTTTTTYTTTTTIFATTTTTIFCPWDEDFGPDPTTTTTTTY